jgi:hypothetical protein
MARGVAQPGSALGSGPRGRRFNSGLPDQLFAHFFEWSPTGKARGTSVEIPAYAKASARLFAWCFDEIHRSILNRIHPRVKPVAFCEGG